MSWKCEVCDTYNDDSQKSCFVCGTKRSARAVKETRKIKRDERAALKARKKASESERSERSIAIENKIINRLSGISLALFYISVAAVFIAAGIALIIHLVNGSLQEILDIMTRNILPRFKENFLHACSLVPQLAKGIWDDRHNEISHNAAHLYKAAAKNIDSQSFSIKILEELYSKAEQSVRLFIHTATAVFVGKFK